MPRVRRHYLFLLAALFWTVAGAILSFRGTVWLGALPREDELLLLAISLLIMGPAYYFGFSKIVRRNIQRIQGMPGRANIFAFTALRGYLMIAMMMAIGIALRNSTIPKSFLIVPYYAMGGVLLIGSLNFYLVFLRSKAVLVTEET